MQISENMGIFIKKIVLLFVMIVTIDICLGALFNKILCKATLADFGRDNHICSIGTEDILVFGSSRAVHHYNTKLIEDAFGKACYNCGEDGQGVILHYGRLNMNMERRKPDMIIYDIMPDFDLLVNDNHKYLKWLKPHSNKEKVAEIIKSVDQKEGWKIYSSLYCYNSMLIELLISAKHIGEPHLGSGFVPLNGEMDIMKIKEKRNQYESYYKYDSLKIQYINKFLDFAKNVNMLFVVSPIWYGQDTIVLDPIKKICKERKIQLIDFSNDPKYVHQNKYFKDGAHLNAKGADEFTKDLIVELRKKGILNN